MNLLISEPPLQVLPSLAVKIGLNEAMFLQQVHYWLGRSDTEIHGHRWIYNTVKQWRDQFPFWSEDTITRIVKNLRQAGFLVVERLSPDKRDKTNFYRIDYDLLARISDSIPATCGIHDADLQDSITADCGNVHTENTTENYISTPDGDGGSGKSKINKPRQPAKSQGLDALLALGVQEQHAADWLQVRKDKGAPSLTSTALDKLRREADKAQLSVGEAVRIAAEKGWRGFEARWLLDNPPPPPRTPPRTPPAPDGFDKREYGHGGKL